MHDMSWCIVVLKHTSWINSNDDWFCHISSIVLHDQLILIHVWFWWCRFAKLRLLKHIYDFWFKTNHFESCSDSISIWYFFCKMQKIFCVCRFVWRSWTVEKFRFRDTLFWFASWWLLNLWIVQCLIFLTISRLLNQFQKYSTLIFLSISQCRVHFFRLNCTSWKLILQRSFDVHSSDSKLNW